MSGKNSLYQTIETSAALAVHDPANTAWCYQLACSHFDLGIIAFARGDLDSLELTSPTTPES